MSTHVSTKSSPDINILETSEEVYHPGTEEMWSKKQPSPFPGYLAAVKLRKTFLKVEEVQENAENDEVPS